MNDYGTGDTNSFQHRCVTHCIVFSSNQQAYFTMAEKVTGKPGAPGYEAPVSDTTMCGFITNAGNKKTLTIYHHDCYS